MVERLTEDDWDRIEAFAKTPAYARQPELLLPEDAEVGDETGTTEPERRTVSAVPTDD